MLDADTKRRIDSCRDILVGKVPDPKSQVEQITIALIYKFMDDMDAEAEELGGKRSFFAGGYEKYGWAKLMAPNMGGFDVLALYSEAIGKMNENPGIPALFRDIFKNAYLPYRDPETLRSFLKEINVFTYDHSEKLGDAFEYLLSVLGSQGDAGQFRTPRHIIDFMVELIDPQKGEKILDPACGTAGFLISAWKHILKQNTQKNSGDLLTPEHRAHIAANVHGYDISPDMVRLSLVNLYLHGFSDPHIVEYDTLTSEDKWNDYADVILANPPFMSPKGGIKPHKRFSIQASRSEVLFVDYIAEHLTPNGRAAIIVPEGIIFQSGTAYKQLRQMLVKNSLVAVISLPAGVFNPYSGVKTSILILDKWLAKRSDDVLFIKVENDGFNLGAQRRAMAGSGLPDALSAYQAFRQSRESENPAVFDAAQFGNALAVEKTRLGENGEWNLSGERYVAAHATATEFNLDSIGNVCEVNPENIDPAATFGSGIFEYIDISSVENETGFFNGGNRIAGIEAPSRARRKVRAGDVLISTVRPNLKAFTLLDNPSEAAVASTGFAVLRAKPDVVLPHFVLWMLRSEPCVNQMVGMSGKGAYPSINQSDVEVIKIPLPPIAIQKEIVAEIEGYQKIIDGARQVVENYQPRINIQPDWPLVELGEICENLDSKRVPITQGVRKTGAFPYYGASGVVDYVDGFIFDEDLLLISEDGANLLARSTPIAFSVSGKIWVNNHAHVLRFADMATQRFVETYINSISVENYVTGAAQPKVNQQALNSIKLPLPDLETQRAIVAEIEAEQALVNANKQLIARFEAKIQTTINRVWGKDDQ